MMNESLKQAIEAKIAPIFSDYPDNSEIQELHQEISSDLLASASDKINSGVAQSTAVEDAIKEFGDIEDLLDQVMQQSDGDSQINRPLRINKSENNYFQEFDDNFDLNSSIDFKTQRLKLVNEINFDMGEIQQILVQYHYAKINVLPSDNEKIVLQEYISRDNPDYYANTNQSGDKLTISQGKYPYLLPLKVIIQLMIPKNYRGKLMVDDNAGITNISDIANLSQLTLKSNSGSCQIQNVSAVESRISANSGTLKVNRFKSSEQLIVEIKSGSFKFDDLLSQDLQVSLKSGVVKGQEFVGGGSIKTTSGSINFGIKDLSNDLRIEANSGTLTIVPDSALDYNFDLSAKSGTVKSPRNAVMDHDTLSFQDGKVGKNPQHLIRAVAKSGTIKLK